MKDIKPYQPQGMYRVRAALGRMSGNMPEMVPGAGSVRLGISLNGRNHEGARFTALAEWTAAHFGEVHLFVADSLQRHNIMFATGQNEAVAAAAGIALGDAWMAAHAEAVALLDVPVVHRWEDLKKHFDFEAENRNLHALYAADTTFAALIDADIKGAWLRKLKNGVFDDKTDYAAFARHSVDYIIEELAVMAHFHEIFPGVEAYPGDHLKLITAPERLSITALPRSLRNYPLIKVGYRSNPAFAAEVASAN